MLPVILTYTLRNGTRGRMHCLARSTSDAVLSAIDHFGPQLRTCSARTAAPRRRRLA